MAELNKFYKCSICGNIVEVVHAEGGELVCCGQAMELLTENTVDAAIEKHVPVVEKTKNGFKVSIGSVPHPMEEAHYIEWVTVYFNDGGVMHKYLKPGDKPEAEFISEKLPLKAIIYCNLHGLWSDTATK
jgi:superoxide reductase